MATVSTIPRAISWLAKPLPVSAKASQAAAALMPEAELMLPYEGGRPMLQVDDLDDRAFLRALVETLYAALPEPKRRTKRAKCGQRAG